MSCLCRGLLSPSRRSRWSTTTVAMVPIVEAQPGPMAVGGLLFVQGFQPDAWFTAARQERLAELMREWRAARDRGEALPPDRQAERDRWVEAELVAARRRTMALSPA